jgi:hypothetical protein
MPVPVTPERGARLEAGSVRITLPRLVGTRETARDLLAEHGVPESLTSERVVVLCRDLASGSTSFADELVKELLVDRAATQLILVGAPERFVDHVRAAAARRGVAERVQVRSGAELGV